MPGVTRRRAHTQQQPQDKSRDNLHDTTIRGRELGRRETTSARPPHRAQALADLVKGRDSIERQAQHQLACARRPAERRFGIAHSLACTDHPPQNVGESRAGAGDRRVETALASIWAALGSGSDAEPPRPGATGAASHAIVTRGASCARSQSHLSRSPASYWRLLTKPRASSQPSGDSSMLTVTDRRPPLPCSDAIPCSTDRCTSSRRSHSAMVPSPFCDSLTLATSAKV